MLLGKMDNGSKNGAREEIFNMEKESQDICNRERKKIQENQANCVVQVLYISHKS